MPTFAGVKLTKCKPIIISDQCITQRLKKVKIEDEPAMDVSESESESESDTDSDRREPVVQRQYDTPDSSDNDSDSDDESDEPVNEPHMEPVNEPNFDPKNYTTDVFWTDVAKFNWKLKSEEQLSENTVNRTFNRMSEEHKNSFKDQYYELRDMIKAMIVESGVFLTINVDSEDKQNDIAGHFVMMGLDSYQTILMTPSLAEYFHTNNEIQDCINVFN